MTSRNFEYFLTPPPIITFWSDKAFALSSQNLYTPKIMMPLMNDPLIDGQIVLPFLFSELAVEDKTGVEKKSYAFFPNKCVCVCVCVCVCSRTKLIMR